MMEKSMAERMAILETLRVSDKQAYETRIGELEHELSALKIKFDALKAMLTKIAVKWGGFGIALMALGVGLTMSGEKIKEILIKIVSIWTAP